MKKILPSWEKTRKADNPHSPEGIDRLKETVKGALIRYYTGIAEVGMWEYTFEGECFNDFNAMTRGVIPEKFLMQGNAVSFFRVGDQVHALPAVLSDKGVNWYGNWVSWKVTPVGASALSDPPLAFREVMARTFTDYRLDVKGTEPAVLMWDNAFANTSDYDMIVTAVDVLVDNLLGLNQLALLASNPVIYRCGRNSIGDAKNAFLAMAEHRSALFVYEDMEQPLPATESQNVTVDTGLITLYSHWESILLQQLGIPSAQSPDKKAQLTEMEAEMTLGEKPVDLRRREKLAFRQKAVEELNEFLQLEGLDGSVTVISTIDSMLDDEKDAAEFSDDEGDEKDENE